LSSLLMRALDVQRKNVIVTHGVFTPLQKG
jgi:hypothetical protein